MELLIERVDVWAASIEDKPGALAGKLAILAQAGADLEFVISRRSPETPGTGVIFVTPLRGDAEVAAAAEAGFTVTQSLHSLRVQGDNKPGICAELTQKLADAGINLRAISAAVIGTRFIVYIALDNLQDMDRAASVLQS